MLRKRIAVRLVALALATGPAMAQAPAPGSVPQPTGPGRVIGTPQDPGAATDQSWAMGIPLAYLGLVGLGGGAVLWYVLSRRRRRG